jgi:REP-associated tyrosine transposase
MRYRRARVPGGTYFFTLVTGQRRALFNAPRSVRALEEAIADVRSHRPFEVEAQVILPDHLHAMWALPEGDADYSTRWRLIKSHFTRAYVRTVTPAPVGTSRRTKREQSVWQRRFWEHLIRDERDFAAHLDYIHYNPVRHGLAAAPRDWPHSTFAKWVARGAYEADWGSGEMPTIPDWFGGE